MLAWLARYLACTSFVDKNVDKICYELSCIVFCENHCTQSLSCSWALGVQEVTKKIS